VGAAEQDEWLRAAWRVTLAQRIDPERLVFTDEMGADASLSIQSVLFTEGTESVLYSVPRDRGPNTTLLSRISAEGMGTSLAVEGATAKPSKRT
jgi:hypothetical protein